MTEDLPCSHDMSCSAGVQPVSSASETRSSQTLHNRDYLNNLPEHQWVDIHGGRVNVDSWACVHVHLWDHDCGTTEEGLSCYVKLESV